MRCFPVFLAALFAAAVPVSAGEISLDRLEDGALVGQIREASLAEALEAVVELGGQSLVYAPERWKALRALSVSARFAGTSPAEALTALLAAHRVPHRWCGQVLVLSSEAPPAPPPARPASQPARSAPSSPVVPAGRPSPHLAHVRLGQRYRFTLEGGIAMVWEIRAVQGELVHYQLTTELNGAPFSAPQREVWQAPRDAPRVDPGDPDMRVETVRVGERELRCLVTTTAAEDGTPRASWLPLHEGRLTFPGVVRIVEGERVVLELLAIEEPPAQR